uniref:Uncharacterized protein n=1 Tax=viral metagenome TaxID=1070528 RepID=A0A6C0EQN5_9ZZZZ
MIVDFNKKKYIVNNDEFTVIQHKEYTNLKILKKFGLFERLFSLINEIHFKGLISQCFFINTTHGGILPIECSHFFENIYLLNTKQQHNVNILKNISENISKNISNILELDDNSMLNIDTNVYTKGSIFFSENNTDVDFTFLNKFKNYILITTYNEDLINKNIFNHTFELKNTDFCIYLKNNFLDIFKTEFKYYIEENGDKLILNYDNLMHLCIMVKDAGPQFEEVLKDNLHLIDRWTILDTGSTDETVDIINKVLVGKKEGELFKEPFINFRDSRNRLLDLAGTKCKFIIMLDDTYIVEGNLREFLNEVRGDKYTSSFSIIIQSNDVNYGSNRIIKADKNLRYIYKIHEVISDKDNINVIIPEEKCFIKDITSDYMKKRTNDRKQLDLKLLYEEIEDDPMNCRTYYYIAQTYNLLGDYEKAYEFFLKRSEFTNSGFIQERIDAVFESARIANFQLNKPWAECEELYNKAYKIDESRPDSLYFIGIHYYMENNFSKAYFYFKKGFELGFPKHCQYGLKPTLSYYFLPKYLANVCYIMEDYKLGLEVCSFFLSNNKSNSDIYSEMVSWYKIYEKLTIFTKSANTFNVPNKPILCFIADGGFTKWSGKNILNDGVGGSETYIIEIARYIQRTKFFDVYVFCNCQEEEVFEGVKYKPLTDCYSFVNENYIHTCIVSRFSEYLPLAFKGYVENVYFVIHDLTPTGLVIPIDNKLKNIFCLTEWHVEYFTKIFPLLKDITVPFYYGCNFKDNNSIKEKYKFIYSSFPNRGLLELLIMWPKIHKFQPLSTLHIFCDLNNKWSNDVEPEKMNKIKSILNLYLMQENKLGITYHGWVKKSILEEAWRTADIWFYPCTFMETFSLTALEAASTKTLVITNNLAGLQNTVGDRGVIIYGDASTDEWKKEAFNKLIPFLKPENEKMKKPFIERNYEWSLKLTWENQANKLLNEYILKNKLEYKGMYNWTNDSPNGTKEIFFKNIYYFNTNYAKIVNGEKVNILEVGTYTGTSLIELVKNIPKSNGIGIDLWSSYEENELLKNMNNLKIEESFYKNIRISHLENRIKGIKSDSTNILIKFIQENKYFDFIYIDGSHKLADCYSDIILSWRILEKGGILVIDDYYYLKDVNILHSPYEAINHFLEKYKNEYKLLDIGYRVFLQKL